MVLDRDGTSRDALVDRLQVLIELDEMPIRQPGVAYRQMQHPHAPAVVREVMRRQPFTLPTTLTSAEQQCFAQVLAVMRGNSTAGQHDADAAIVFDAKKYGGYLVTEDARILRRRAKLRAIPGPAPLWIVTLAEFMVIYDRFVEEAREREKLLASLR
jgi:hypothetical protein